MKMRWIGIATAALMVMGVEQTFAGQAQADEALAKRSGCLECHAVDTKKVGPAYRDVAARYRNDSRARDALIEKIRNGGRGNWTDITGGKAMPPHSELLSAAEIAQLVKWILSQ